MRRRKSRPRLCELAAAAVTYRFVSCPVRTSLWRNESARIDAADVMPRREAPCDASGRKTKDGEAVVPERGAKKDGIGFTTATRDLREDAGRSALYMMTYT